MDNIINNEPHDMSHPNTNGDLSGIFKKVTVGKGPSNSPETTSRAETNTTSAESKAGEPESAPEDLDATKLLNVHKEPHESEPQTLGSEGPELSPDQAHGARPPHPSLNKAVFANLPRIAGDNEATQYFQVPGTTLPPLHNDLPLRKQPQSPDSAGQAIGFTQLLRSISSRHNDEFPDVSQRAQVNRADAPFSQASPVPAGEGANEATLPTSHPSGGSGDITVARKPDRRLHDLLPWLLLFNLALTGLVLVAVLCMLFHISVPVPGTLRTHN